MENRLDRFLGLRILTGFGRLQLRVTFRYG
jgi:hypothetical protein